METCVLKLKSRKVCKYWIRASRLVYRSFRSMCLTGRVQDIFYQSNDGRQCLCLGGVNLVIV